MRKMFFAALAAVAMFVTSCGSSVEYETLSKDYNNSWKVSAVVPKGVYKLNDTLPAAIPAAIQEAASISKPLYLAGDKIAIGFTKGEVYDQTFATWAANYKIQKVIKILILQVVKVSAKTLAKESMINLHLWVMNIM